MHQPPASTKVRTATQAPLARILARLFIMHTVPLSEAKDRLSALVEDVQSTHEAVTITRHGRPAVVMMAVDDLESLQETLFWLSQPGIREDLAEAERERTDGGGVSVEQLREQLRAKRP
jgi:antitoxin YefM